MKLVIISNMAHYRRADGVIIGHGATARELDQLATLFDRVSHVACLHDEPPPASALPYSAANIALVTVPPAGGDSVGAKLGIVGHFPLYARTILRELDDADAVHVRCPANISMLAVALLSARREPRRRWIKYAGNWSPAGAEPTSYMLQRIWLGQPYHRAQVSINGAWAGQPSHVHTIANPSLTKAELERGRVAGQTKHLGAPVRLLFVGHLGPAKGPRIAIEVLLALRRDGLDARLDLAGEGAELEALRAMSAVRGITDHVTLHGALPRAALDELYGAAHFVVLPSLTEGWPKVLSEGMASGALPIATAVGSIPSVLKQVGAGCALPLPPDASAFAGAIRGYLEAPEQWRSEIQRALRASELASYETYLAAVRTLLDL
jgi:glycosyltransferase involved in cell wall biosynthesis